MIMMSNCSSWDSCE